MTPASSSSEIVLYTTPDGTVKIDTVFQDEIIWLTQKKMANLLESRTHTHRLKRFKVVAF
jgi:hypothetical protein